MTEETDEIFADRLNIDTDTIGFKEYTEADEEPEVISLSEDDEPFDEIVELDSF